MTGRKSSSLQKEFPVRQETLQRATAGSGRQKLYRKLWERSLPIEYFAETWGAQSGGKPDRRSFAGLSVSGPATRMLPKLAQVREEIRKSASAISRMLSPSVLAADVLSSCKRGGATTHPRRRQTCHSVIRTLFPFFLDVGQSSFVAWHPFDSPVGQRNAKAGYSRNSNSRAHVGVQAATNTLQVARYDNYIT